MHTQHGETMAGVLNAIFTFCVLQIQSHDFTNTYTQSMRQYIPDTYSYPQRTTEEYKISECTCMHSTHIQNAS